MLRALSTHGTARPRPRASSSLGAPRRCTWSPATTTSTACEATILPPALPSLAPRTTASRVSATSAACAFDDHRRILRAGARESPSRPFAERTAVDPAITPREPQPHRARGGRRARGSAHDVVMHHPGPLSRRNEPSKCSTWPVARSTAADVPAALAGCMLLVGHTHTTRSVSTSRRRHKVLTAGTASAFVRQRRAATQRLASRPRARVAYVELRGRLRRASVPRLANYPNASRTRIVAHRAEVGREQPPRQS